MTFERDPASVLWDTAAKALLQRARKAHGGWQGTRIADPTDNQRAALAALGINVDARDNPSAVGGRARVGSRLDYKTRWARAFVRAVRHANDRRHGGPGLALDIQVGRHKVAGVTVPAGRAVRIRVLGREQTKIARDKVARLPDSERVWTDDGYPGQRWSDPNLRDWG